MKENKVLSFDLLRVERNRGKLCKCDPPHLEVDPVNRIVTCKDCGATIDPLEALLSICKYNEQLEEYQREALKKARMWADLADSELRRRIKNAAFKDMDKRYRNGLYPVCPCCGEIFDPMEIRSFSRKPKKEGD